MFVQETIQAAFDQRVSFARARAGDNEHISARSDRFGLGGGEAHFVVFLSVGKGRYPRDVLFGSGRVPAISTGGNEGFDRIVRGESQPPMKR